MSMQPLRVGLIGAGENTRKKHIPGLLAIPGVELLAVCNRRAASTAAVSREFQIPRTCERWQDLVADRAIDAIVIGTWPYLHAAITIAALQARKHVLCEARMSMNLAEAREMLATARRHPEIVAQLVPSPFGLKGDAVMRQRIQDGYLGVLREIQVIGMNGALADPATPLSWRQDAALSGINMLTLGIVHETLLRWVAPPVRVMAQATAFTTHRIDPESGVRRRVGTPDSVQVLTTHADGARGVYQFSGVVPLGGGMSIRLWGTEGTLHYDLLSDRIFGASRRYPTTHATEELQEIAIPPHLAGAWNVEADFVRSIREGCPVQRTDFETGVRYMAFTEAVARSIQENHAVEVSES